MEPDGENRDTDLPYAEQRDYRVALIASVVLAVLLIALAVFLFTDDDDDDDQVTTGGTTTTEAPTSTVDETTSSEASTSSSASTTSTPDTGGVTDEEAATIAWPDPAGATLFATPDDVGAAFATDMIGFTDPVVGEFQCGDSLLGEIEVRAIDTGPATTVMVRQMSDDNWYVLAAVTPEIEVDSPTAGSAIDDPLQVTGRAMAFEGTVDVAVYQRDGTELLGSGFVTGSGGGEMGPFTGEIEWENPGGGWGLVVFSVASAEDGSIWQATVLPVGFIGGD